MEGSQQAPRAEDPPSDGATTERVAQAAQLFANLTQPGKQRANGDQPQPEGDPNGAERVPHNQRVPDTQEVLLLLLAANERTEREVDLLRSDLDVTISNVKLLHAAVKKALRVMSERIVVLEGKLPKKRSKPG